MNRTVKWAGALAATAILHIVVYLVLTGVPHPPAIVADGVGRVGWASLMEAGRLRMTARHSESVVDWLPDGSGMLTLRPRMIFDVRLHAVDEPGSQPRFLPSIPRNARIYTAPGRPYSILGVDRDGDEQYALYRWDLADGALQLLTSSDERAVFGAFEPDGSSIAYVSTRRNRRDFDIYVSDALDPSSEVLLAEMDGMWRVADWSPDGRRLLVGRAASNLDTELFTLEVDGTGQLDPIPQTSAGTARITAPQWSRDGKSLYYASDRGTEFSNLRRLDLGTGREATLFDQIEWDVESIQQSGDAGSLLIGVNEDGRTRYYVGGGDGGELRALDLFPSGQASMKLHPTDPLILVNHVDDRGNVRGYEYDMTSGALIRWVGAAPKPRALPTPRTIRYATFDSVGGEPRLIPAFVYPGMGDGPRPVLIDIHGGPEAQARLRFGYEASQRRGVTVITPNVRGSTGYGRTYVGLDDWTLRENAVRDIGALLDWIEAQPDLDGDRVVVTGGSYGGYMVLASLVHYGPRLRCGVDVVGLSNFVTFLENTADYRKDVRRAEYGDERIPEMRAFLEDISPLNNAERITSRLMVVQGANDPRVPVGESRQIVDRVRASGLDVSYVEAADEGHGFRKPWNALWTGLAQRTFVDRCLSAGE